ncbi:MAG: SusC/RagA family TonB-linked outer membrane protein, partial [Bacteroidales bacterium]
EYRSEEAQGFISDELTYYQTDVATQIFSNASFRKQTYLSQMFRLNYTYSGKYLLTFTVRRDGYSGFGENRKYGTFPSAAIGWNIYREPFLQDNEILSLLKIRASYGLNGNQAVPAYS